MSLQFHQKKNSNSLVITQKPSIELINIGNFDNLSGTRYENEILFGEMFTPLDLNEEFFQHCLKTWIIVDEFVFVFDKSLSVQI
jgi:hypothetical protein